VTAPATLTPVTARLAAPRSAAPTGSDEGSARGGSTGVWVFGLAAPAAARPGLALARFPLEPGAGFAAGFPAGFAAGFPASFAPGFPAAFAAGFPAASALTAAFSDALAGLSRFALRFPGRELGSLPRTPPSSVMDGDSSSARSGYTLTGTVVDKVLGELTG
jgi:hypothetical protein